MKRNPRRLCPRRDHWAWRARLKPRCGRRSGCASLARSISLQAARRPRSCGATRRQPRVDDLIPAGLISGELECHDSRIDERSDSGRPRAGFRPVAEALEGLDPALPASSRKCFGVLVETIHGRDPVNARVRCHTRRTPGRAFGDRAYIRRVSSNSLAGSHGLSAERAGRWLPRVTGKRAD